MKMVLLPFSVYFLLKVKVGDGLFHGGMIDQKKLNKKVVFGTFYILYVYSPFFFFEKSKVSPSY